MEIASIAEIAGRCWAVSDSCVVGSIEPCRRIPISVSRPGRGLVAITLRLFVSKPPLLEGSASVRAIADMIISTFLILLKCDKTS